jgi:Clustered mitochondria/Translation initiation factor eIF3 subunit 135
MGVHQNWTQQFYDAYERAQWLSKRLMTDSSVANEYVSALESAVEVAHDFATMAKKYGELIISEIPLPNEVRTIPALTGRGTGNAGGMKYLYCGIFFKLANDWKKIYGSDYAAAKASNAELRGLVEMQQALHTGDLVASTRLYFPQMVLIDFHGFRLVAVSILPLQRIGQTPAYGSDNAGRTVQTCPEFESVMNVIGANLNLAQHRVGPPSRPSAQAAICLPVDIEGHKGRDGKLYALDFARVFPPEYPLPSAPRNAIFYNLLRPELVRSNAVALSSDALSKFGWHDKMRLNGDVLQATKRLYTELVPCFVAELNGGWMDHLRSLLNDDVSPHELLVHGLHRSGVNIRHLGVVFRLTTHPTWKQIIMEEMIARTAKSLLRERWRDEAERIRSAGDVTRALRDYTYRRVAIDVCQDLIGRSSLPHDHSAHRRAVLFWANTVIPALHAKFRSLDVFKPVDVDVVPVVSSSSLAAPPTRPPPSPGSSDAGAAKSPAPPPPAPPPPVTPRSTRREAVMQMRELRASSSIDLLRRRHGRSASSAVAASSSMARKQMAVPRAMREALVSTSLQSFDSLGRSPSSPVNVAALQEVCSDKVIEQAEQADAAVHVTSDEQKASRKALNGSVLGTYMYEYAPEKMLSDTTLANYDYDDDVVFDKATATKLEHAEPANDANARTRYDDDYVDDPPCCLTTTTTTSTATPPPEDKDDDEKRASMFDLADVEQFILQVDFGAMFERLCLLCGIKVRKQALDMLKQSRHSFQLTQADLPALYPVVKRTNIVFTLEAELLLQDSYKFQIGSIAHDRLFALALSKYRDALNNTPKHPGTLIKLSTSLFRRANMLAHSSLLRRKNTLHILRLTETAIDQFLEAATDEAAEQLANIGMSACDWASFEPDASSATCRYALAIKAFEGACALRPAKFEGAALSSNRAMHRFYTSWALALYSFAQQHYAWRRDSAHRDAVASRAAEKMRVALRCDDAVERLRPHHSIDVRRWADSFDDDAVFCDAMVGFMRAAVAHSDGAVRCIDASFLDTCDRRVDESLLAWSALWRATESASASPPAVHALRLASVCVDESTLDVLLERHAATLELLDLSQLHTDDDVRGVGAGGGHPSAWSAWSSWTLQPLASSRVAYFASRGHDAALRRHAPALAGHLRTLLLARNTSVSGDTLASVLRQCTGLRHLDVSCCVRVDHALVASVAVAQRSLAGIAFEPLVSAPHSERCYAALVDSMAASANGGGLGHMSLRGCPLRFKFGESMRAGLARSSSSSMLAHLDLGMCVHVDDDIAMPIVTLAARTLRSVVLPSTRISDDTLAALADGGCSLLATLNLDNCALISGAGVVAVALVAQLRTLSLNHCTTSINDRFCKRLVNTRSAHTLRRFHCAVGNFFLDGPAILLAHCPALQVLSLSCSSSLRMRERVSSIGNDDLLSRGASSSSSSAAAAAALSSSSSSSSTSSSTSLLASGGIESSSLLQLRSLDVSRCNKLTTTTMVQLLSRCAVLRDLNVSDCAWVNHEVMASLSRSCPSLRALHASKCLTLDGSSAPSHLLSHRRPPASPSLHLSSQSTSPLSIEWTLPGGSDMALYVPNSFPHLRELNLQFVGLGMRDIGLILEAMPALQVLRVGGNYERMSVQLISASRTSASSWTIRSASLRSLTLLNTPLTPAWLEYVLEGLPNLEELELSSNRRLANDLASADTFEAIARASPQLRELAITGTFQANGLAALGALERLDSIWIRANDRLQLEAHLDGVVLPSLAAMHLSSSSVRRSDLVALIECAPKLHFVDLTHCPILLHSLASLQEQHPHITFCQL